MNLLTNGNRLSATALNYHNSNVWLWNMCMQIFPHVNLFSQYLLVYDPIYIDTRQYLRSWLWIRTASSWPNMNWCYDLLFLHIVESFSLMANLGRALYLIYPGKLCEHVLLVFYTPASALGCSCSCLDFLHLYVSCLFFLNLNIW